MKPFLHTILIFLTLNSCFAQKNETLTIYYDAQTRGHFIKITMDSEKLVYADSNEEKFVAVSKKSLDEIQHILKKLDLNSIKDLSAPSTKSHTDAALSAFIKIDVDDTVYQSNTFDHGNPPEELKELVDLLFSIAKIDN